MFKKLVLLAASWLLVYGADAQSRLSGQITDERGEPLPGANLFLKESKQGTAADARGDYEIQNVKAGKYTLQVTYVGYKTQEEIIIFRENESQKKLNIRLSQRAFALDRLIVNATRSNERTPMTFTNLNKEEIEQNNLGQDVPYVLRWTPSAVVTSDAGAGIGYTGIRIRGTDPTRINVTINGIPLNDAESQGVFWVDLPDFISSTEDIQIQRGVGGSTNGAGAFGATINLNTASLKEEAYVLLNSSTGSFNTWKANVQFGTGLLGKGFSFDGRLSKITSDGYIDRATADLESFYLSGAYTGDKSLIRVNVFSGREITYQAWNGVSPELLDDPETRTYNSAGMEKSEEHPHEDEVDNYRQTHYQLLFSQQLPEGWNLNLALHYTKGEGYFEQYKASQSLSDYGIKEINVGNETISETDLIRRLWLDNDFYGGTYALNYRDGLDKIEFTLGGAYNIYEGRHFGEVIWARFAGESELGDDYYDNDARKTDFNIYGKLNYQFTDRLNAYADLQYRRVGYQFLGFNRAGDNVTQDADLSFFNPKFGLFYQVGEQTNVYASFAVANREPNRNDYTESSPDTRPKPERLYNTELGLRRNWQKAGLELNFYHMRYQDQLALNGQINDVGAYTRINIDDSYRLGLELSGGLDLSERLHLKGNANWSRNKVKAFTEFADSYDADFNWLEQKAIERQNTDLAFSPNLITGGELSYDLIRKEKQTARISLLSKYVGKQYIDNASDENNVLEAYTFSDVRIQYRLNPGFAKEVAFTLLLRNIFDSLYETNAWSYRYLFAGEPTLSQGFYPQAGRNFLLSMRIGF